MRRALLFMLGLLILAIGVVAFVALNVLAAILAAAGAVQSARKRVASMALALRSRIVRRKGCRL